MSNEFCSIYEELLTDIPDNILVEATKQCLLNCRFFPTIAEFRDRSMPFLQEYNLKSNKLIENNVYAKCEENVFRDAKNFQHCKIENNCEFGINGEHGKCKKWEY